MKISIKIGALLLTTLLSLPAFSAHNFNDSRLQVVKQYLLNLKNKDAVAMLALFEAQGTVVSTSKGKVAVKDFFNGFLPELQDARVQPATFFVAANDPEKFMARFRFNYKLKSGEEGGGEYVDEFSFAHNSNKLKNVAMFENTKF